MSPGVKLNQARISQLLSAAREGAQKSFLTKEGNTRYGAAVLTASGRLYSGGQYSSFNHITNVHAETAAVLLATMSGDPEIVGLALVSTASTANPPTPCGVCRQVLHEHSRRIGRDILVVMATWDGSTIRVAPLSQLLPEVWVPRSLQEEGSEPEWGTLPPWRPGQGTLQFGDLVQTASRFLSVVWAPEWEPGLALLKMKYDSAVPGKLPHSFTQFTGYLSALRERVNTALFPWGEPAYLVPHEDIQSRLARLPLAAADLARQQIEPERIEPLISLLGDAGIAVQNAYLTCSWVVGLARPESDFDVVVVADPSDIQRLRMMIRDAFLDGELLAPAASSTWTCLASTGKSPEELVREGRFVETFVFSAQDTTARCSLIYLRPGPQSACFPMTPQAHGVTTLRGTVVDASEASYKPAMFTMKCEDGARVDVQCWHKWSGLLKEGDDVTVRAVECRADTTTFVQTNPDEHTIQWIGWQ